jgi:hypothetical protein
MEQDTLFDKQNARLHEFKSLKGSCELNLKIKNSCIYTSAKPDQIPTGGYIYVLFMMLHPTAKI